MIKYYAATAQDFHLLWPLFEEYLDESAAMEPSMRATDISDYYVKANRLMTSLLDSDHVIVVAREDDALLGYASLYMTPVVGPTFSGVAQCDGFYVTHEGRRRGVAGALYRWMKRTFQLARKKRVQALVLTKNRPMAMMLEARGWRPIAVVYEQEVPPHVGRKRPTEEGGESGKECRVDSPWVQGNLFEEPGVPGPSDLGQGTPQQPLHLLA